MTVQTWSAQGFKCLVSFRVSASSPSSHSITHLPPAAPTTTHAYQLGLSGGEGGRKNGGAGEGDRRDQHLFFICFAGMMCVCVCVCVFVCQGDTHRTGSEGAGAALGGARMRQKKGKGAIGISRICTTRW